MKVYTVIAAIVGEMSKVGISKGSENKQQGYKFRGIDAVYGALSPLLAKHGLCILPRVMERSVSEQTSKSGGVLFYTILRVEFDFVCAEDGSKHTVCTVGEAMDSGDKSSNKAMSAAYKYACIQAFCIPTEGENDADAHTHEVVKGHDPRGDLSSVDSKLRDKHVSAIADILNADEDEQAIAEYLRNYIAEYLQQFQELYIAVAEELAARKIISKAALKDYLKIKRAA